MNRSVLALFVLTAACAGNNGEIAAVTDDSAPPPEETSAPAAESGAPDAAEEDTPADSATPAMEAAVDSAPATRGMFVAQGHVGRTMISCDDGRTWIKNRSDDDAVRCFEGGFDCDHTSGSGRGITFGAGWFVATFGWGKPGSVRRSRDGFTWEKTLEGTTFGGVVFDENAFVATSRAPQSSADAKTWTKGGEPPVSVWNVRSAGFGGGSVLMIFEDSGKVEVATSSDSGKTWNKPSLPSGCGAGVQGAGGVVEGKGVVLIVGGDGTACRTTDLKSWTSAKMGGSVSSFAHFTGSEFVAWGRTDKNVMYRSADGVTWTTTATKLSSGGGAPSIGPSAMSDAGTFVASNSGWMVWYEKQAFYRSADGVTWDALPKTAFTGSHPIRAMAFGRVDASACK